MQLYFNHSFYSARVCFYHYFFLSLLSPALSLFKKYKSNQNSSNTLVVMVDMNVDEIEFKGYLFRASDFLQGPNVQEDQLSPNYEEFLKKKGVIPVSTQVFIPVNSPMCVDWTCPGWFSIFEIAFRTGFSLPCSKLMQDVIRSLGVMPFQLMPSVWKLIAAVESLCKKHQLVINLQDLMNCYHVRTVGKGRVSFRALKAEEALITSLDSGDDKNWSSRFMFINIASLGEGYSYLSDRLVDKPNEWEALIDDASLARLTAFRSLGAKERTWPRALCKPLTPPFDSNKSKAKSVVPVPGDAEMADSEKVESGEKDGGSENVAMLHEATSGANPVSTRTRGKGKLSSVAEEIQALKKRVKIETSNKNTPILIPASPEPVNPGVESPEAVPLPVHSPETLRIRRALRALSLHKAERDFCEASSSDRSDDISGGMAELVEPEVLDLDYDSLMKRSVFASFQALHFSSAAVRAKKGVALKEDLSALEISALKAACSKIAEDLDLERVARAESLLELESSRAELKIAKDSLKSLDEKMLKLLNDQEEKSKEVAVQYTLMARIGMMLESAEQKASWNVQEEIEAFKLKFPDSSLEEWGVPEVEDSPAATK